MLPIYHIFVVGLLSCSMGGLYLATLLWSPFPEALQGSELISNWLLLLLPGAVCVYAGWHVLSPWNKAPARFRWLTSMSLQWLVAMVSATLVGMLYRSESNWLIADFLIYIELLAILVVGFADYFMWHYHWKPQ